MSETDEQQSVEMTQKLREFLRENEKIILEKLIGESVKKVRAAILADDDTMSDIIISMIEKFSLNKGQAMYCFYAFKNLLDVKILESLAKYYIDNSFIKIFNAEDISYIKTVGLRDEDIDQIDNFARSLITKVDINLYWDV